MNHTKNPDQLACELRAWAKGSPSTEASIEALTWASNGYWLTNRPDFVATCIKHHEPERSSLDYKAAGGFARNESIASSGQIRMLHIAVSLGSSHLISLDKVLTGLDAENTTIVLEAIAHSRCWHEQQQQTVIGGTFKAPQPTHPDAPILIGGAR